MLQYINKQIGEQAEVAETAYAAVSDTATSPCKPLEMEEFLFLFLLLKLFGRLTTSS